MCFAWVRVEGGDLLPSPGQQSLLLESIADRVPGSGEHGHDREEEMDILSTLWTFGPPLPGMPKLTRVGMGGRVERDCRHILERKIPGGDLDLEMSCPGCRAGLKPGGWLRPVWIGPPPHAVRSPGPVRERVSGNLHSLPGAHGGVIPYPGGKFSRRGREGSPIPAPCKTRNRTPSMDHSTRNHVP